MKMNSVLIEHKIYLFSATFAGLLILIQLVLINAVNTSDAVIEQQNTILSSQFNAVKSQESAIVYQGEALVRLALVNEIADQFSQVRYWLYDLSASWLNESESNAEEAQVQLLLRLDKLAVFEPQRTQNLQQNLAQFTALMLGAVDAYIDDNRGLGNALLAKSRTTGEAIDDEITALLYLAQAQNQFSRTQVGQAKTKLANAQAQLQSAATQVSETNERLSALSFGMLVIIVIAGVSFSIILTRAIVPALQIMKSAIEDINRNSDLSRRIDLSGGDELGATAGAFNQMLTQFQQIVTQVVEATRQVNESMDSAQQMMSDSQASVTAQHQETELVAAAVNQMSMSISEVVHNTQDAATATKEAEDYSREGQQIVDSTIKVIHTLSDKITAVSEVMQQVNEASVNIDMVLDVIRNISEQTNLLALNAAIEAARAGESGKGFAVVADEVRALAKRTHDSTRQIQTLIETLQSGATKAVEGMEESKHQTTQGVDHANKAGASIHRINKAVSHISQTNEHIANAAQEQATVTAQINQKIVNINAIAAQTSSNVTGTSVSIEQLTNLTKQLGEHVRQFKI